MRLIAIWRTAKRKAFEMCIRDRGKSREELLTPVEALDGQSVADALLTPTRIYVKQVLGTLKACPGAVRRCV